MKELYKFNFLKLNRREVERSNIGRKVIGMNKKIEG